LTIKNIFFDEGIKGFYRGTKAAMMTVPLFHSLYFPLYEYSKEFYTNLIYGKYKKADYSNKSNTIIFTLSSASSAIICDTITNPFWIIRLRNQTEFIYSGSQKKESFNIIKEIYKIYKTVK
jgi:hypothetical protein